MLGTQHSIAFVSRKLRNRIFGTQEGTFYEPFSFLQKHQQQQRRRRQSQQTTAAAATTNLRRTPYYVTANTVDDADTSCRTDRRRNKISFITDIEGDRAYLERYVLNSKILMFRAITDQDHQIHQKHHLNNFPYPELIDFQDNDDNDSRCILVCGGDVGDQGGSDLYVLRQLLSLRYRYPDQVHLILGNRDINKMRIPHEMNIRQQHRNVYWARNKQPQSSPPPQAPIPRLQWMLQSTMGSPRAFRYRKMELQSERANHDCAVITDEDVVQSYLDYVSPNGEMTQYLSVAKLIVQIGDAIFMHGALPFTDANLKTKSSSCSSLWDDLTFAMPWLKSPSSSRPIRAVDVGIETISDWMNTLNKFAEQHVSSWKDSAAYIINNQLLPKDNGYWAEYGGYRADPNDPHYYGNLLQYGMGSTPDRVANPTVVYNRWGGVQHGNDGKEIREFLRDSIISEIREFFRRTNSRIICCGHQPMGQVPNHIRIPSDAEKDTPYWILSCDTSYSGDVIWLNEQRQSLGRGVCLSGRGPVAVSEVFLEQVEGQTTNAFCHGILCDGSPYRTLSLNHIDCNIFANEQDQHPRVGMLAHPNSWSLHYPPLAPNKGPWWTQAELDHGKYLLAAGSGFQFWNMETDA